MKFEILFHFSHGPLHVLETKRLDLLVNSTPAEVYQWFLVEDRVAYRLKFESMSLNPQRRVFQEGMIEFDLNSCRGRLMDKDIELTRQDKRSLSLVRLLEEALIAKGKVP